MSIQQRENLDAILRQSAFPAVSDVNEQRRQLRELLSAQPMPAFVSVTAGALGGAGQSWAAPLGASRQRRTRRRLAKGGTHGIVNERSST